jgi:putative phosphoribosyl transferase
VNFPDRSHAGEKLGRLLLALKPTDPVILAIPREGVAVARPAAKALGCDLDVIPLMKLPVPWSAEASYGVVAMDGTMVWNRSLMNRLDLSERELEIAAEAFIEEARKRAQLYRKDRPFPRLADRTAVLIDDGVGSGYSMLAAVNFAAKRHPRAVIVAAPVISGVAHRLLAAEPAVSSIVALVHDVEQFFSLGSYFQDYSFLTDDDVVRALE